ncbi:MAG: hypothetical protein AAFY41_05590 [Bacteroidota bacterium]
MDWILTIWALALFSSVGFSESQLSQNVPPDHIRIQGKLVSLSSRTDNSEMCQQNPCWAFVQVSKIIGYGSAFRGSVTVSDTVQVKFTTTLLPTQSLFPKRKNHLPGLVVNDRFQADMKQAISQDFNNQSNDYEIATYSKKMD